MAGASPSELIVTTLVREYGMPAPMNLHQITRLVSEGTGLTPEEVRWWVAMTASVVAASGVLHAVEAVRRLIGTLGDG